MGIFDLLADVGLTRRRERREARSASRLLTGEMDRAASAIRFALAENSWGSMNWTAIQLKSWPDGSRTLAAALPPRRWSAVELAAQSTAELSTLRRDARRIYPNADGGPETADRTELERIAKELEDAIVALARVSRWSEPAKRIKLDRRLAEKYRAEDDPSPPPWA